MSTKHEPRWHGTGYGGGAMVCRCGDDCEDGYNAHLTVDGYFIAPDANDEMWVWRKNGDYPVAVLAQHDFREAPDLWDVLTTRLRGGDA